jgi:hypothetical protein
MKRVFLGVLLGLVVGALAGAAFQKEREAIRLRTVVGSGPYSDNFAPARQDIAEAIRKLRKGDPNDVIKHLEAADDQLKRCEEWTDWFLRNH